MLLIMNLLCLLPVAILCQEIASNDTNTVDDIDEGNGSDDSGESEDYSEESEDSESAYADDTKSLDEESDSEDSEDSDAYAEYEDESEESDDEEESDDDSESSGGENEEKEILQDETNPIQNLTANVFDNDKALLRWNKIVSPDTKDRIMNFKVKIQKLRKGKRKICALSGVEGEASAESMEIIVPADKTEAVFSGMEKGTTYEIEVKSYTRKGKGLKSMKVQIQRT